MHTVKRQLVEELLDGGGRLGLETAGTRLGGGALFIAHTLAPP